MAVPIFIFAVESIFSVEVIETLHRLGREVPATILTGDPEWDLSALKPMKASELTVELLSADTVVPWVTPGLKWQKVIEARNLGFQHFPALADPSAIVASTAELEEGVFL